MGKIVKMEKEYKGFSMGSPVLTYQEEGVWFAHALVLDLIGDGETQRAAIESLTEVLIAHIEFAKKNKNLENICKLAPKEYWEKLNKAEPENKWFVTIEAGNPFSKTATPKTRVELEACLA